MTITTSMDDAATRFRRFWQRSDVRRVLGLWALITVLLVLFAFVPAHLMGPPASPTMRAIEDTMTVFSIAAAPVAAVVWAVALYSLLAWRHKGREQPEIDGPALRTSRPAATVWLVASSVLCVFLLVWGLAEMGSVASAGATTDAMVVNVTGQQWVWTFSYPDDGGVQSDQLYLPVNRPVVFHVTSKDVVHSFWVVQLGIKVDANPGQMTKTSVVPDKVGTYDVRCAELCGLLHADMETNAHVVSGADFKSWIAANGGTG
ncbi:MAG: cytochrome c oxidase subunit [Actinomycetota bacterium]|nr:cytochrome c oxidase subunit [Actinomycetota bacterium]